jgi:signal transduction histidine kinase
MLVEDDQDIGLALTTLLQGKGYSVDHCSDGSEALRHLRTAAAVPDLILLDLMMPHMNGWEFRVEQRRDPEWASVPVVVMSADRSAQASAIDADGYIAKPIDPPVLLDTIEGVLTSRERSNVDAYGAELDRMNALGVLAAGLAHEINNPLAFVVCSLEVAQRKCARLEAELPGELHEHVQALSRAIGQVQHGAERIANVVRDVATFARPNTEQVVPMNVQEVLESSLRLVANEIRHHAQLERTYEPVPPVMANPARLGQVFINLLINAVHSLGEADAQHAVIGVDIRASEDGQVVVSVSDTGVGISAHLVGKIFDPFFSTKPIGAGMGMGLAICRRLISSMNGSIRVESTPGHGSTFFVTLPSAGLGSERKGTPTPPPGAAPFSTTDKASLLIIDDEVMMIDVLRLLLEDYYEVTTFSSARAALKALMSGKTFDVVLCDVMMPEMTGTDLYAEIARQRPDLTSRFIFMTGGTFSERARAFLESLDTPPISKPFRLDQVRAAVESRLRAVRSAHRAAPKPRSN